MIEVSRDQVRTKIEGAIAKLRNFRAAFSQSHDFRLLMNDSTRDTLGVGASGNFFGLRVEVDPDVPEGTIVVLDKRTMHKQEVTVY